MQNLEIKIIFHFFLLYKLITVSFHQQQSIVDIFMLCRWTLCMEVTRMEKEKVFYFLFLVHHLFIKIFHKSTNKGRRLQVFFGGNYSSIVCSIDQCMCNKVWFGKFLIKFSIQFIESLAKQKLQQLLNVLYINEYFSMHINSKIVNHLRFQESIFQQLASKRNKKGWFFDVSI